MSVVYIKVITLSSTSGVWYTGGVKGLRIKFLLILLAASLLLMFLDTKGILEPVRSTVQVVTAPLQYGLYRGKLAVRSYFSFLTFWKSGEARIKDLELRVAQLAAEKNRADDLERENEALRRQLGVDSLKTKKLLPAAVLGKGKRLLEINVAAKEGSTVVFLNNLVGKVTRGGRISFVMEPTDPQAKIPVIIGSVSGLVGGQFGSSMILDHVAQAEKINVNDIVVTSGEGGSYVPGLVVGKIKKITSKPTDIFAQAEVVPLIDYGNLDTVFVILD